MAVVGCHQPASGRIDVAGCYDLSCPQEVSHRLYCNSYGFYDYHDRLGDGHQSH